LSSFFEKDKAFLTTLEHLCLREEEENNLPQMKKLFFLYVWLNLTRIAELSSGIKIGLQFWRGYFFDIFSYKNRT